MKKAHDASLRWVKASRFLRCNAPICLYGCVVHELDEVTVDEGSLRRLGTAYRFPWVLCSPPYSRFQALMSDKNTMITSLISL